MGGPPSNLPNTTSPGTCEDDTMLVQFKSDDDKSSHYTDKGKLSLNFFFFFIKTKSLVSIANPYFHFDIIFH